MAQYLSERSTELQRIHQVKRTLEHYELALVCGEKPQTGFEFADFMRALAKLTGFDEAHTVASALTPPEADFFGNPVHSLAARVASASFDEGKQ